MFDIFLTDEAKEQLDRLKIDKGLSKRYKAVKRLSTSCPKIQGIPVCRLMSSLLLKAQKERKFLRHTLSKLHQRLIGFSGITGLKKNRSPLSQ